MDSPSYLAKNGKVYGPYEAAKIAELKASGDFYDYEWMWDGQAPDWAPVPRKLKSPPPLPGGVTPQVAPSAPGQKRPPPSPMKSVEIETSKKLFPAICFDNRTTMGGEVSHAHSRGGRFVSLPNSPSVFPKGATVSVDLLDEAADKTAKIKSVVSGVSRLDNRWVLELEWGECPLL